MAMAMVSAISGKPARSDVAMTGGTTLRGNVLAIGGLNEKLLAAKKGAASKPFSFLKENEKDLTEIQDAVKDGLKIVPIEKIEDALKYVFGGKKS